MVYCGKPSKACGECRAKRTKCDALRPSCSQCNRAGRICGGYRSDSELIFRDQTKAVTAKGRSKAKSQIVRSGRRPEGLPAFRNSPTPEDYSSQPASNVKSLFALSTSAEEQATCFFFRNYVLDNKATKHFNYLLDIYSNEIVGNALSETIMALGMAGLSNFRRDPKIMVNAQSKYNSALRLVSSRLRNVDEAKADQTLISVMLLGLYETNTCSGPQSMKSWTQHISGAASLLNLRGKQQLQTPVGHALFLHLRSQVLVNCLQRRVPVPASINEWSVTAMEYETVDEIVSTRLSQIIVQLCNLRGTMDSFHDYSDPERIILGLHDIDMEFTEWAERCPSSFIYHTVTLDTRSEGVFSDHYHVYSDSWFATIWNHYRSVRILTNELILSQLTYLRTIRADMSELELKNPVFSENQLLTSTSILIQLSHDICASVPYTLGYSPNQGTHEPSPHSMRAVSGNLLLWPLFCAACTPIISDMMCHWVAGRLKVISEVMGIRQAAPLANFLRLRKQVTQWEFEEGNLIKEGNISKVYNLEPEELNPSSSIKKSWNVYMAESNPRTDRLAKIREQPTST